MCELPSRSLFVLLIGLLLGLLIGFAISRSAYFDSDRRSTSASFDEERLASILTTPDRLSREKRLLTLFENLAPEEVDEVWESFKRLRPNLDASAILALMDWWAGFDPGSALETAGTFGELAPLALATVVRRWAQHDPLAARDALEDRKEGQVPQVVLALVRGWEESGQPGVWRHVEEMPMGALRQQAIGTLVSQMLMSKGPDAMTTFVEGLPDAGPDHFKLLAFRQVAAALALRDPERAKAWVGRHSGGPFGEGLLFKAALSWAVLDGEAAVTWLASLPADDDQQYAMRAAYGFWLQQDRASARAWLQESGEMNRALEPAWILLVFEVGQDDPRAGLDLLSTLAIEDELRESTTVGLVSAWAQRDPVEAQSWLASASLPEHVVEKIKKARPPKRRQAASPTKVDTQETTAAVAK